MKLIDAEVLKEKLKELCDNNKTLIADYLRYAIEDLIDEEEPVSPDTLSCMDSSIKNLDKAVPADLSDFSSDAYPVIVQPDEVLVISNIDADYVGGLVESYKKNSEINKPIIFVVDDKMAKLYLVKKNDLVIRADELNETK